MVITEIGGTVGDIESLPFLEAARQVRHDVGRDNCFFLHVSLVPYIGPSGELKTKPTQHSVAALRSIGIQPDAIVCRSDREIPESMKRKISLMCDVDDEAVVTAVDAPSIYDIPKVLHSEGLDAYVVRRLNLPFRDVDWTQWDDLLRRVHHPAEEVTVALVGKYIDLPDAYLSVAEALRAGGFAHEAKVNLLWVPSDECQTREGAARHLADVDAVCVPGGFGIRGIEGKVGALRVRPDTRHPHASACAWACSAWSSSSPGTWPASLDADSTEFDPGCIEPVIATMAEQKQFVEGGGRPRRHHAARALPGRPQGRVAGAGGVRRGQGRGAAPAPLRGQQRLPRARSRRPGWCSPARRRTATWSSSSSCRATCTPTTCHPGAPRAALPSDPAAPAVRRPGPGGHRPAARAALPDRRDRPAPSRRPTSCRRGGVATPTRPWPSRSARRAGVVAGAPGRAGLEGRGAVLGASRRDLRSGAT